MKLNSNTKHTISYLIDMIFPDKLYLDCKITRLSCSVSTIVYQALRNKYNQPCYKHIILCVFCLNFNYAEEQISNEK